MAELRFHRRLDPADHEPHALHALDRDWPETNCYIDVWIELLGALGLEVEPMLGFLFAADFEGDQWTFSKPPTRDLELLYGIQVEELNLWRPLLTHIETQIGRGQVPLLEVDSHYLPDTGGTDYRSGHTKTTVAMVAIDATARSLTYFHNRSLRVLDGADFDGLFRHDRETPPDYLPPFCEIAKLGRVERLGADTLRERAFALAQHHFAQRPARNPLQAYGAALDDHLQWLLDGGLDAYHAYSFSLVRQLGANAELLSSHLRWLDHNGAFGASSAMLEALSTGAKTLLLKLARIANSGRKRDLSGDVAQLADCWERAMDGLVVPLGR